MRVRGSMFSCHRACRRVPPPDQCPRSIPPTSHTCGSGDDDEAMAMAIAGMLEYRLQPMALAASSAWSRVTMRLPGGRSVLLRARARTTSLRGQRGESDGSGSRNERLQGGGGGCASVGGISEAIGRYLLHCSFNSRAHSRTACNGVIVYNYI